MLDLYTQQKKSSGILIFSYIASIPPPFTFLIFIYYMFKKEEKKNTLIYTEGVFILWPLSVVPNYARKMKKKSPDI